MPPIISAIFPDYQQTDRFKDNLAALINQLRYTDSEIIVVCPEETIGDLESILSQYSKKISLEVVTTRRTLSAAEAFNAGVRRASGDYLLFVQPWIQLRPESLDMMLEQIRGDRKTGLLTPGVQHVDGTVYPYCRKFPNHWDVISTSLGLDRLFSTSGFFNRWKMGNMQHENIQEVDSSTLLVWMIQRITWQEVGDFDENFPEHFYDIDWCCRLQKSNYRILYYPLARAVNHQPDPDTSGLRHQVSLFRLLDKHYDRVHQQVLNLITGLILYGLLPVHVGLEFLKRYLGKDDD